MILEQEGEDDEETSCIDDIINVQLSLETSARNNRPKICNLKEEDEEEEEDDDNDNNNNDNNNNDDDGDINMKDNNDDNVYDAYINRQRTRTHTVTNVVSTFLLGVSKIDLAALARKIDIIKYKPREFAAAVLRFKEPKTSILIFSTGKAVSTGARSEEQSRESASLLCSLLAKHGLMVQTQRFVIQNVVGTNWCDYYIDLMAMYDSNMVNVGIQCSYDPQLFPGLIVRLSNPKVVFLVFDSGKVVCTGAKSSDQMDEAFKHGLVHIFPHYKIPVPESEPKTETETKINQQPCTNNNNSNIPDLDDDNTTGSALSNHHHHGHNNIITSDEIATTSAALRLHMKNMTSNQPTVLDPKTVAREYANHKSVANASAVNGATAHVTARANIKKYNNYQTSRIVFEMVYGSNGVTTT